MACRAELRGLGAVHEELQERGGTVLAISADAPSEGLALITELGLEFPVLSDQELQLARQYGLVHAGAGPGRLDTTIPAMFLIGRNRQVLWCHVAKRIQDRADPKHILEAIAELRN